MKRILIVLSVILISTLPVIADIDQRTDINGGNAIVIKVNQAAYNYGSGDIIQTLGVDANGNLQITEENTVVMITDPDYGVMLNSTMNGINIIRVDLSQMAENYASGNVIQNVDVEIEGNIQKMDQEVTIFV